MLALYRPLIAVIATLLLLSGCATMQTLQELSKVKFTFDRISSVSLAGMDMMQLQDAGQLNMIQLSRATLALARGDLPLQLGIHLKTENPIINQTALTLAAMDWTLMLDNRETISGSLQEPLKLPAGVSQDIPLLLRLNLVDYFDDENLADLLDLALAIAGSKGSLPQGVALKVRPKIATPLGLMTYSEMLIKPQAK